MAVNVAGPKVNGVKTKLEPAKKPQKLGNDLLCFSKCFQNGFFFENSL